jgi:LPS-assembly lipoprotein
MPKAYFNLFFAAMSVLVTSILLSGCGFHLSNQTDIPFSSIYIESNGGAVANVLRQMIILGGHPEKLAKSPAKSERILQILNESGQQLILAITGAGLVSEYQLQYQVEYQLLTADGKIVIPPSKIVLNRDMSFNPNQPYAYGGEEDFLNRDMQTDAAHQILRRISMPQKTPVSPAPATE